MGLWSETTDELLNSRSIEFLLSEYRSKEVRVNKKDQAALFHFGFCLRPHRSPENEVNETYPGLQVLSLSNMGTNTFNTSRQQRA